MGKLTYAKIKSLDKGKYHDGQRLYLVLYRKGAGKWTVRYRTYGRSREMGLGPYPAVSLAEARQKLLEVTILLTKKIDPIEYRNEKVIKKQITEQRKFSTVAATYIEEKKAGWRNTKHAQQWENTLKKYAYPILDSKPLYDINTHDILKVLNPIWKQRNETAKRVQQRIANIFTYAIGLDWYEGKNPAHWKEKLSNMLAHPKHVQNVTHHPSLPYEETPKFYKSLIKLNTITSYALRFTILTAARTSEVIGARFDEVNFEKSFWCIPQERMKTGLEHKVPLSKEAITIVNYLRRKHNYEFLFVAQCSNKPISNNAMRNLIRKNFRHIDITVHGFRSSFREWAEEYGSFQHNAIEYCLAHQTLTPVQRSYMRSDLFDQGKEIMNNWSKFILKK